MAPALFSRIVSFLAAVSLIFGGAAVAQAAEGIEFDPQFPPGAGVTKDDAVAKGGEEGTSASNTLWISEEYGYGWCIDLDFYTPTEVYPEQKFTVVEKLDKLVALPTKENPNPEGQVVDFTSDSDRRDVIIHLVRELQKAYDPSASPIEEEAQRINFVLRLFTSSSLKILQNSYRLVNEGNVIYFGGNESDHLNNDTLEKMTGYRIVESDGFYVLEHTGNSENPIPKAADSDYLTVIRPENFDLARASTAVREDTIPQRVITIDQPGLRNDFNPEIETSASYEDDTINREITVEEAGKDRTVYDTVTVKNLVEGAKYTLDAQLMKQSDSSEIAGAAASKEFTASESELADFVKNEDGSVSGSVVVEVPMPAGSLAAEESAVAFETLSSTAVDAKGRETPNTSEPNPIAEHKDINDEAQTVSVGPEPVAPKIELVKKINGDDAETEDAAVALKPGEEAEVTFEVTNVGETYAFNVGIDDETLEGTVGAVTDIKAEGSDSDVFAGPLKPGESTTFTGKLVLEEGAQHHADRATAHASSAEGDVTVSSEPNEGHAKTPEVESETPTETSEPSQTPETSESEPTSEESTTESEEPSEEVTEAPVPEEPSEPVVILEPSISTSVNPASMAMKSGAEVVDTVSYKGLKPDTEYTLNAQLVNKDNADQVIGVGEKTFTTPASEEDSVSGEVDVKITLTDNAEAEGLKAGVAFEELTSKAVDAKGSETPDTTEPNVIAEHKDIEDKAQTVTNEVEPKKSGLEIKKYIKGNDAQSEEEAVELEPGEEAEVSFEVTNTGDTTLFNITLSDETVAGVGTVENIAPESVEALGAGQTAGFVGKLTLPEAGQKHQDVAKAEGTPEDSENPGHPAEGQPKVTSNEDPAHAKTPEKETKPDVKPEESAAPSDNPDSPAPKPEDEASQAPETSESEPEPTPSSEEAPESEEPAEKVTEEPAEPSELEPSISTSVNPKSMELNPGGRVVDTVSYEGLKPDTEYHLRAQMVDKNKEERVIGSGEKTFTTPKSDEESVSGDVDVEITFNANAGIAGITSGVAFEELTSKAVDAKGNETPDATEPNAIAEHKDIEDEAQTVNFEGAETTESEEPSESAKP
ncbi:VaFE repeat-containing surface-anchored protein [Corynebacterium lowii]|uniref:Uncharacterized protein n=1 Tax=Corynebacterium lowii TaxID=1544413 RepID=A0A0Q1E0K7_9CORY|nr:VaFE repeat-containing surface-anchored protein [Corynebacterium lowii]KQB86004.1 hypothetical protein Clow_01746 [Corynebacterium lowii]MDP9850566.1 putative cupredoxin-like copper-binding protein [Corynebacterium lowii]